MAQHACDATQTPKLAGWLYAPRRRRCRGSVADQIGHIVVAIVAEHIVVLPFLDELSVSYTHLTLPTNREV